MVHGDHGLDTVGQEVIDKIIVVLKAQFVDLGNIAGGKDARPAD